MIGLWAALFAASCCTGSLTPAGLDGGRRLIREYTPVLRAPATRVQGCVVLQYIVRPDGKTDDFRVLAAFPAGAFEINAIEAVYGRQYEAALQPTSHTESFGFDVTGTMARASHLTEPCRIVMMERAWRATSVPR